MSRAGFEHAHDADLFLRDPQRAHWHDQTLWMVRAKRDVAARQLPEWELLRETASQIKQHTQSRLADYLEQFAENAARLGAQVHWAADAAEHNNIVLDILHRHNARDVFTLDRRRFEVLRRPNGRPFRLLPRDA